MSKHMRLESNIMRALTSILRQEVKDPQVGFVTLTEVRLTNDLSYLNVYYTTLSSDKKREDTQKALDRSKPFIRTALGKHVQIRKLPNIIFNYDESLETGNRIERGLKDVLKDNE